jgi:hypothetical protein
MYALMSQFTRFARQQHRFAKVSKQARLIGRNENPSNYYKHWKMFGTESNTLTAFSSLDENKPMRFFIEFRQRIASTVPRALRRKD